MKIFDFSSVNEVFYYLISYCAYLKDIDFFTSGIQTVKYMKVERNSTKEYSVDYYHICNFKNSKDYFLYRLIKLNNNNFFACSILYNNYSNTFSSYVKGDVIFMNISYEDLLARVEEFSNYINFSRKLNCTGVYIL